MKIILLTGDSGTGKTTVAKELSKDIKYNVCIVGNYAIHNFNYTDRKVCEILKDKDLSVEINNFFNENTSLFEE